MLPEQIAAVMVVLIPLLVAINAYIVALTHQIDKRVTVNEVKLDGEMGKRDARSLLTEQVVSEQGLAAARAAGRAQRTRKDDYDDAPSPPVQGAVHDHSAVRPDSL